MVMSCAGLHMAVNRCPETGVCSKGYYQLVALCGLERTDWQWFLELSPMWAAALGSLGAIEQEALEVLRGQHGHGGWLPVGMNPKMEERLWQGHRQGQLGLPIWQVRSLSTTCQSCTLLFSAKKEDKYLPLNAD